MPSSTLDHPMPKKRSIKPVILMFVLFGAPYLFSWYFFFSGDTISISSPTNKGILISPIKPLSQVQLPLLNGGQLDTADFAGYWTMMMVTDSCQQTCSEVLFTMQQSRKAMAVKRKFIKRVLIVNNVLDAQTVDAASQFEGTQVVAGPANSLDRILDDLKDLAPKIENTIFLVDPKLNLMMAYTDDMPGTFLLKDLERLFKIIQMEDVPGANHG